MKYQRLLLPIYIVSAGMSNAQNKSADHWFFGEYVGIEFSSGTAVPVDTSALFAYEGTAAYSDENGDLLFYTNGVGNNSDQAYVWNKNHEPMPNGSLGFTTGYASPMQSSIVVPVPGSDSLYYLFTLDGFESYSGSYDGLQYLIIDMSLDGGLGDVSTALTDVNVPAVPYLAEQMAVTKHANGTDYWLVLHESSAPGPDFADEFFIYQITSGGLVGPLTQNIGDGSSPGAQGTIEITVDGDRLAHGWNLYDFDNATGILSNPIDLNTYGYKSFSSTGRFLYVSSYDDAIYQFDLEASDVPASKTMIANMGGSIEYNQMQIGPDKKIYVAKSGEPSMAVINDPDVLGSGCNFVSTQITFTTGECKIGLPNFIDCDLFGKGDAGLNLSGTLSPSISIYPNPSSDFISLIGFDDLEDITSIQIWTSTGEWISVNEPTKSHIDISFLAQGTYILRIAHFDGVCNLKFVKGA